MTLSSLKSNKSNKNSLLLKFFVLKLVFDIVYVGFVNKVFSYSGFLLEFNQLKYLFSIIVLILVGLILPKNKNVSSFLLWLHAIIILLPMLTLYSFENQSSIFMGMASVCFIIECIIVRSKVIVNIPTIKNSKKLFNLMVIVITISTYGLLISANGIPTLQALDFWRVYDLRETVKFPFMSAYLSNWQGKIINPILITMGYYYKNRKLQWGGTLLQFVLYLITGSKIYLFIPLVILFFVKTSKERELNIGLINVSILGTLISYFFYKLKISLMLPSLFIRRLLFIPAKIKFYYFDYISRNEFIFFGEGIIGKLFGIQSPYSIKFANLIGDFYYGTEMNANAGYIASGYANAGFIGMLIYSIVIAFILILLDSFSKKINKPLVTGLSLFVFMTLNDIDLLTTLLTGGLLLLLILLFLYPRQNTALKKE